MQISYLFGNVLTDMFTSAIDAIGNFFFTLFQYLIQLVKFIIFGLLYRVFSWICILLDFAENLFKSLAGIDTITLDGVEYGGSGSGQDLVYGFITNESVMNVFWSIIALSLVLLLVFTIVAFIKSEFTLDLKGSAKGPIIGRAFKSFVNLIAVPAVSIVAIFGVNFLTRTIYQLFDTSGTTLSSKCFYVGAYTANRARLDSDFAQYVSGGMWIESGSNPFGGSGESLAEEIDEAFKEGREGNVVFKNIGPFDKTKWAEEEGGYADWFVLIEGYPSANSPFHYSNVKMVNYFYDLVHFQYLFAMGSAIALAWTMLTVCLVLVKRVFELTILFLLAPPMTAIAPLDGGQAEKKWRQEFTKRLLSVIGTVFAYNMYFLLIPIFENITVFGSVSTGNNIADGALGVLGTVLNVPIIGFFNNLFQIICVMVGMSIVKSASALISNLLGIEDLVKSGGETAKKAMEPAKSAVGLAAGVTLSGIRGAAVLAKGGYGVASGGWNKIKTAGMRIKAKSELGDAKDDVSSAKAERDSIDSQIDSEQKAYDARAKEIARLNNLKNPTAADRASLAQLQKEQEASGGRMKDLNVRKGMAEDKLREAGRSLNLRKSGMSSEKQAEYDEAAQEVWDKRGRELEGVDETSDYYKETKADIEQEAQKAFNESAGKTMKSLSKRKIYDNIRDAYLSEFGENAADTSWLAKGTKRADKFLKDAKIAGHTIMPIPLAKVPFAGKLSSIMQSVNEWASAEDNRRRLQDMFIRAAGEGSGAEAARILTNPNARAKLFESIPEEKTRGAKIDNENAMKGRDKYFAKRDADKAKEEELKTIKRYVAYKQGITEYDDLIKKKQTPGLNAAQIDKIDAQIKQLDIKGGINSIQSQAEEIYKKAGPGSDELKQLQAFKDRMQMDATRDKIREENSQKAMANRAATSMGQAVDTKITEQSADQLAKAIANALFDPKGKGFKVADGIKIDPTSLSNALGSSLNSLGQTMEHVAEALKQLAEKNKKS